MMEIQDEQFGLHLVYNFTFEEGDSELCVSIKNKGEHNETAGYGATVDNEGVRSERPELKPGEVHSVTHNVDSLLSIYQNNHSVMMWVSGTKHRFNFTRHINASSPDVPAPEITSVDVLRNQENNSTSLQVSTHNPTERGYGFYVQVETLVTNGGYTVAAPQPNKTETVTLPLDEGSDEVVAGKVRIFEKWGVSKGMYDQKEFLAKPNETANAWDDSFDRVPGTVDTYNYENESAAKYRDDYEGDKDDSLPKTQRRIGAALVVVLPLVALLGWRRWKHR
jgi:hypothetical protein